LTYACVRLSIDWTPAKALVLPLALFSGALIYAGLIVAGAAMCFWTIRTPEVLNAFLFGGEELTSYPLSIYNRWLRSVFLFLVPLGLTNYPAALLLLGRTDPHGLPGWLAWLSPLVAALFFGAALAFWRLGVSKYTSTGS
jgi:ABC-2 type transport system permease protein